MQATTLGLLFQLNHGVPEQAMLKRIDNELLDELADKARHNPRRRLNLNFHQSLDEPVQRLFNAMEPDSYVRPHRHAEAGKWEFFLVIRGTIHALIFTESGAIKERLVLSAQGPTLGLEIPDGHWHTLLSMESNSLVFEVKPGPYQKISDKDFAPWAPSENDEQVSVFLQWLKYGELASLPPAW